MVKLCVKTISLSTKSCACVSHVDKGWREYMRVKGKSKGRFIFMSACSRHRIYAPALSFPD
jgi:hypothetical protein